MKARKDAESLEEASNVSASVKAKKKIKSPAVSVTQEKPEKVCDNIKLL